MSLKAFLWYYQALFYLRLKVCVSIKLEAILSFIHHKERREERILQSCQKKYSTVLVYLSLGLKENLVVSSHVISKLDLFSQFDRSFKLLSFSQFSGDPIPIKESLSNC